MKQLILSGISCFFALYYLGLCQKKFYQFDQADEVYEQVSVLYPGLGPNSYNLLNIE